MKRNKLIEKLKEAATFHDNSILLDTCFRLLYGLNANVLIDLCLYAIKQYLPIFKEKYPSTTWPEEILTDIKKYINRFGRGVPNEPLDLNIADSSFLLSFDALLLACTYKSNQCILTSSCTFTINSVVMAKGCAMLISQNAVDLQGLENCRNACRQIFDSEIFKATKVKEWNKIVEWLVNKDSLKSEYNTDGLEICLKYWKQGEMSLIVPETRLLLEKVDKPIISLKEIFPEYPD